MFGIFAFTPYFPHTFTRPADRKWVGQGKLARIKKKKKKSPLKFGFQESSRPALSARFYPTLPLALGFS